MQIFIKNMVCNRCITAVAKVFTDSKIEITSLDLGEVQTKMNLDNAQVLALDERLQDIGFEILQDAAKKQIEKIKKLLIAEINSLDLPENFVLSKFLTGQLHRDYSTLSRSFSQHENVTLEQYFILQKIEKVKELLLYNEFTLTEIAGKLGYNSVQHLSAQFRKITGFTPSDFKAMKRKKRISIDQI